MITLKYGSHKPLPTQPRISLTQFIGIPEINLSLSLVRSHNQKHLRLPRGFDRTQLVTKPKGMGLYYHGLVGTAFDYLLRLYLHKIHKIQITPNTLVAEHSIDLLLQSGAHEVYEESLNLFNTCIGYIEKYLVQAHPRVPPELIEACVVLAQLDRYYRNGTKDPHLGEVESTAASELKTLIDSIPEYFSSSSHQVLLNPTFNISLELPFRADADLVIDNTLIDIKTTMGGHLTPYMFNQLLGYYLLYQLRGFETSLPQPKITHLGIYFARYSELVTFPILWYKNQVTNELRNWFYSQIVKVTEELEAIMPIVSPEFQLQDLGYPKLELYSKLN